MPVCYGKNPYLKCVRQPLVDDDPAAKQEAKQEDRRKAGSERHPRSKAPSQFQTREESERKFLELVRSAGDEGVTLTAMQIAKRIGCGESTVKRIKQSLIAEGTITAERVHTMSLANSPAGTRYRMRKEAN